MHLPIQYRLTLLLIIDYSMAYYHVATTPRNTSADWLLRLTRQPPLTTINEGNRSVTHRSYASSLDYLSIIHTPTLAVTCEPDMNKVSGPGLQTILIKDGRLACIVDEQRTKN